MTVQSNRLAMLLVMWSATRVLAIALSEPTVSEAHDITIFEHDDQVSVSLQLKLPANSSLQQAHDVAERIEAGIRVLPKVSDALTHLERLEHDPSRPTPRNPR